MDRPVHPLVPKIILSHASAGNSSGDFFAVGLFVDISGFSTMTDKLMAHGQHGAEVMAEIMRAVLDPIIESIFAQGGFICYSAGDGLTALFPLDGNASSAAERSLAAAWAIQTHIAGHHVFETPYQAFGVSVKVGLGLGEVRWGIFIQEGSQHEHQRGIYYFNGTAVENCAEAEHVAKAGEIIIAHELLDLLGGQVEVEPAPNKAGHPGEPYYRLLRIHEALPDPRPSPPPDIDPADAAIFFPRSLVNQELNGEFRQVVNMFVALPTVSTETQLRVFLNSLFALQEKWGGLISRLDFGDKGTNLLLYWGAPVAFENDIERALSFILDLQTRTSIPINAGITYRISHAGFIGGRLHEEYTCFGRGINLAARFMMAAPRGEIWVDEPIAERGAGKFEIEFLEQRSFKGFSSPQKIFALYERKAEPLNFYRGLLAGREKELAALQEFIAPLFEGHPAGMLVITGEAGIGKSRLVYEAVQPFETQPAGRVQIFLGQTDEILRQSLNPFVYWLQRYLGVSESQGEARSKRSFNRRLDDLIAFIPDRSLAAELDRTRSFLGALVGLRWPDSLYEQVEAAGRYQNTQIALTTLIQAASFQAPVVFILEDIHWLDGDSAALLARLIRVLTDPNGPAYPAAILATSRDDPGSITPEDLPFTRMTLETLDSKSLHSMAESILGAPLADNLQDLIGRRAEGNPFFAEQIVYYLRDQRYLTLREGSWQLEHAGMDELPANVNALLVARLDNLAQQVKEAVQVAAVLGREFEVNLLSSMLGAQSVPPEVKDAEREAIWTALNEIQYIFKHALLRDAAYQMQVHTRRKALHALAFEAYQRLYTADLSGHFGELAYHAEQAGLWDEARLYLHLAGKAAFETFQNQQAIDYFTRALALTPESDLNERYDLLMDRAGVFERIGNRVEQEVDLTTIEAMIPGLNDPAKEVDFLQRRMRLAYDFSLQNQHEMYATRSAELSIELGMLEKASISFQSMGAYLHNLGKFDTARIFIIRALNLAREAKSFEQEAKGLNSFGLLELQILNLENARHAFSTALILSQQTANWLTQAQVLNNLGTISEIQGDYAAHQGYLSQAYDLFRKIGDRLGEGYVSCNLGFNAGMVGQYQKALTYLERALRITREIGNLFTEQYIHMNYNAFLMALGETETALTHAQLALDISHRIADQPGEAWAQTYLGHSLTAHGELEPAKEAYRAALNLREQFKQPSLAAEPAAGLARVAILQDRPFEAVQFLEPILAHLESGGSLDGCDEPLRVYLTCFEVLTLSGDPRGAAILDTAYQQLQEQAAKITDDETRLSFLNNVKHHKEILQAWRILHSEV